LNLKGAKDYNLDKSPAAELLRKEYACDDGWISSFLEKVEVGHLATRWDDQPFITPSTFIYSPEKHEIYLHSNRVDESVIVFGEIRLLQENEEKRAALYGLVNKYFPEMSPGEHYREITDRELKRTAVYAIAVKSWSGKRNWPESAEWSEDWQPSISVE